MLARTMAEQVQGPVNCIIGLIIASPFKDPSAVNPDVTNSLTVQRAESSSLVAISRLFEAQLREHEVPADAGGLSEVIRTIITNPNYGFILVAAMDGEPVGVAYVAALLSLEHEGVIGWLEELYVIPERRNFGVGSRLLREVIGRARETGWKGIELELMARHERAASLYGRHGFQSLSRNRYCRIFAENGS